MKKKQKIKNALQPTVSLENLNPLEMDQTKNSDPGQPKQEDKQVGDKLFSNYEITPKYHLKKPTIFDNTSIV